MSESLSENLEVFLRHIDAIRETLPMTMLLIQPYNKKANDDFFKFLKENVEEIEDDNGKKKILVKAEESKVFETLEKNASISALAGKIIPESLFVSLISQYDAFLTRLLRAIYEIKPEILNGSERNLTFSQLVEINSIESAREYIIDKEVDTVLRKSHSEQFDYLEKIIGIKLREKLPVWQTFIEVTERRNLLVHCDGVVSNQYLKNCNEHKCTIENVVNNKRLGVTHEYFKDAYNCLYEISVKLSHTIWRKLLSSDLENADAELNDICFELINSKQYKLADILLEFAGAQTRFHNDATRNVYVINGALSKYLQGEKENAKKILNNKDWSASSDDFKLAYSVLTDDFKEAFEIMRRIGNKGNVDESDYKQWPLFTTIRTKKEFKEVYKEIFKEDYTIMETPKKPVQELIEKELNKDKELKEKTVKKIDSAKELKKKETIPLVKKSNLAKVNKNIAHPPDKNLSLNKGTTSLKRKNTFTTIEIDNIRKLIREKNEVSSEKQRSIRAKIRNMGFYYSDFSSSKHGYTVEDFDSIIKSGQITIV